MVKQLTRRSFLAGAAGLALGALPGCSTSAARAPLPTLEPAEAASAYPRSIQDKFGTVELPARPQRIMCYWGNANLDTVLALGATPALIAADRGFRVLPWQSAAGDVPLLAMAGGRPDHQQVLEAGIDLIVAAAHPDATREANWGTVPEPIGSIPIVTIDSSDLVGQLRIAGDALALQQQAATKAEEIAVLLADWAPPRIPASIKVFGANADGTFYMLKDSSAVSLLLERFGMPPLSWPDGVGAQQDDPQMVQTLGGDNLAELECDLLLGLEYTAAPLDSITAAPLFGQLEAVKSGTFHALSNDESLALAYGSVLTLPAVRDVLLRVLDA